jgi:A/G-specific adenine glycosylase
MLQQTQASRVAPAFARFVARFPDVRVLAGASRADVIRSWEGLGYNRRAVALSEAARVIVADHAGRVPSDVAELRELPGVGPYTAAAVAAIGYGMPVAAVDVNVARVAGRSMLGRDAHEAPAGEIRTAVERCLADAPAGDLTQAMMDLGRDVCRPAPKCDACPLAFGCRFLAERRIATRPPRRRSKFEGSDRQVRGAVVRALRACSPASVRRLASETGFDHRRVGGALRSLVDDGLVRAGEAALRGRPAGRARLA